MIYTKKANFPYPVLMNFTDDYVEPEFELDVTLRDNTDNYILDITWKVSSKFIRNLLKNGRAKMILIVKSKDNQFFALPYSKKPQVSIPKSRICVNARTVIQMMIQATEDISFTENDDLVEFYKDLRSDITVRGGNALGFSNTVIFDGSQKKPYELFERKTDSKIKSDVEIQLGNETILIIYKDEKLRFTDIQNSRELNYPYIYMGLQKALMTFLIHANPENPEEGVQIDEMEPPENGLESKLYTLIRSKNITELTMSNIDEVVYQISDKLMSKYSEAVRGIQHGD